MERKQFELTRGQESVVVDALSAGEQFDMDATPSDSSEVSAFWCLRFLRAVRDVAFATVDDQGLPSVRVIDVMAVAPNRLYFLAPRGKAFHGDVERTSCVALVGQSSDHRMCRLRGRVGRPETREDNRRLIDRLFQLNPFMAELYPGDSRSIIDVFWIEQGEGEYYDLGRTPLFRASFAFGGAEQRDGGFFIADSCIGCGTCAKACPAKCIQSGSLYEIDQSRCLRCGMCREVCPSAAVIRQS